MIRGTSHVGVGTLLRQLLAELDGDVQSHYKSFGVSFRPRFYPIVQHLLSHGSATISDVAVATKASQPAVTQTVNEMKGLGLVLADPGADRRQRLVRLSAAGLQMVNELAPLWQAIERAAASLDEELPSELRTTLESALSALERRPFKERIADELSDKEQ